MSSNQELPTQITHDLPTSNMSQLSFIISGKNTVFPQYEAFLDELKETIATDSTFAEIRKDQISMIATSKGLLFYAPLKGDAGYIYSGRGMTRDQANAEREKRILKENASDERPVLLSNTKSTVLVEWSAALKAKIFGLLNAAYQIHNGGVEIYSSGVPHYMKVQLRACNSSPLLRGFQFIILASLMAGIKTIPIALYQYLTIKYSAEQLFNTFGYNASQEAAYKELKVRSLINYSELSIDDKIVNIVANVASPNNFKDKLLIRNGCSILVQFEQDGEFDIGQVTVMNNFEALTFDEETDE